MRTTTPSGRRRSHALAAACAAASVLAGAAVALSATGAHAAPGCQVSYSVNQWSGGFTANLGVTNLGDPITNGWRLEFDFAGDQRISQAWNSTHGQSGKHVTLTNASWNQALPTAASTSAGFNATFSGTNATPTAFTLNGVLCNGGVGAPSPSGSSSPRPSASPSMSASPSTSPAPSSSPLPSPSVPGPSSAPPQAGLVGFGAGTTGGAGGPTVTVTSFAQLATEAKSVGPKIIRVSGLLQGSGSEAMYVTSNKTIVGVGSNAAITGGGFFIKKATNVIVQNLKIYKSLAPTDLIQIQASTKVWIDHVDLSNDTTHDKDYYDGLLDINHGSDFVTVSWTKFHDHYKGSLVGHSDNNAAEDTGKLRVTYHHNWFTGVHARLPRVRFGTVHLYDNVFEDAVTSGIHCLMGAQCLVQNSVFRNVNLPVWTTEDSDLDGYAYETGNVYIGGTANVITQVASFRSPPYSFQLDPASGIEATVKANAGAGRI